jgi:hypothetical protein
VTIIERVRALLLGDAAMVAIIGDKVHPEPAPQGTVPPFVVVRVIADTPLNDLNGNTSGVTNALVQVDAYATTDKATRDLAATIHTVLAGRTDPTLLSSRMGRRDNYDDEAALHCVSSDFSMWTEA